MNERCCCCCCCWDAAVPWCCVAARCCKKPSHCAVKRVVMAFISSGSIVESVKGVRIRVEKEDVNGYTVKGCSVSTLKQRIRDVTQEEARLIKDKLVYNCCLLAIWTLIKC